MHCTHLDTTDPVDVDVMITEQIECACDLPVFFRLHRLHSRIQFVTRHTESMFTHISTSFCVNITVACPRLTRRGIPAMLDHHVIDISPCRLCIHTSM